MTVDVVVPVHNGARFLNRAVESIQSQGIDVVIHLVDDASQDASATVIAELAEGDSRVRVHRLAQNRGVGAARNVGIQAGSAEFLAFLDQDDEWPAGSLDVRLTALSENPDSGFVLGRLNFVVEPGEDVPSWVRPEWLSGPQLGYLPGALLVRRPALQGVGLFDEGFSAGVDDSDWFARARTLEVAERVIDDVVLTRYVHAKNQSADRRTDDDLLRMIRRHLGGAR